MLEFFRKYQRHFFIVVSVVIIISFAFFGTLSTIQGPGEGQKREDRLLVHAVDGSPLMLSEVQDLSRFISSDAQDLDRSGRVPNLCNDGVIRRDLLQSGLGDLLSASYFEGIRGELSTRLDRAKRYTPYVDPQFSFLSAEVVWERFLPEINTSLKALKEETEVSQDTFLKLSNLYQAQGEFSSESLRRILFFQQKQLRKGEIDPRLFHEDLSLFGFHSAADWFGPEFIDLAAQFILNAAHLAERKGFAVTLEEAKGDLLANFHAATQLQKGSGPLPSFQQHLQSLGFDERKATQVWQKVLLFRRYFQGISQSAFIDRLPYKDFASYAQETALVELYRWPEALRLKNFQELISFQVYLSSISPPLKNPLELPSECYAIEKIQKENPELIQAYFQGKVTQISLQEAALRASVKEVWEYETSNWEKLRVQFPFVPLMNSFEERFSHLEKLPPLQRTEIDGWARLALLQKHPEWIEEAYALAPVREETIRISSKTVSLSSIVNVAAFRELLVKGDIPHYSDDGKSAYRIEELSCAAPEHLLTFAEAKRFGVMTAVKDRFLQANYLALREKSPAKFKTKEGEWKSFSEVKDEVARVKFSELFQALTAEHAGLVTHWTDDLYASYRLLSLTQPGKSPFLEQFRLVKEERTVQRTDKEKWMKDQAFLMELNERSPVHIPNDGDLSFFYITQKNPQPEPVLDRLVLGQEMIVSDAKRYLAEKLLRTIARKRSIVLPIQEEQ